MPIIASEEKREPTFWYFAILKHQLARIAAPHLRRMNDGSAFEPGGDASGTNPKLVELLVRRKPREALLDDKRCDTL